MKGTKEIYIKGIYIQKKSAHYRGKYPRMENIY